MYAPPVPPPAADDGPDNDGVIGRPVGYADDDSDEEDDTHEH